MSGIRAFRRVAQRFGGVRAEASGKRLSRRDILLFLGLPMALLGLLGGGVNARIYAFGQREHVANTDVDIYFIPEEAPGNPGRRIAAVTGYAIGVVGLVLTAGWAIATFGGRLLRRGFAGDEESGEPPTKPAGGQKCGAAGPP